MNLYELTKFAAWMLSPLSVAVVGQVVALLLLVKGRRRAGLAMASVSFLFVWLFSTPWAARTLAMTLEARYPPIAVESSPEADLVLVLGGALAPAQPPMHPQINLGSAADRVWHAGALYREGKARWVLLSAGNQPGFEHVQSEAEAMREILLGMGVPDSAIRTETRSRTTRENAQYSKEIVRQLGARRILLVTSALHMPRALAVFRSAFRDEGVTLIPASTDAEALGGDWDPLWRWLPQANSLAWSTRAIKEYLGLAQTWLAKGSP